jgi:F-type H+-transporting ATPase subunit epsilon
MKLNVYSLKKILFEGEASSVNCKTVSGEITILDNHRPLISMLVPGVLKITDAEQKESYFPVKSGFLEVQGGNQVRFIIDE